MQVIVPWSNMVTFSTDLAVNASCSNMAAVRIQVLVKVPTILPRKVFGIENIKNT